MSTPQTHHSAILIVFTLVGWTCILIFQIAFRAAPVIERTLVGFSPSPGREVVLRQRNLPSEFLQDFTKQPELTEEVQVPVSTEAMLDFVCTVSRSRERSQFSEESRQHVVNVKSRIPESRRTFAFNATSVALRKSGAFLHLPACYSPDGAPGAFNPLSIHLFDYNGRSHCHSDADVTGGMTWELSTPHYVAV